MAASSAVNESDVLYGLWGVRPGPWLWSGTVRILFVLDGRINTSTVSSSFGLGFVIETLTDPSLAWWVRHEVTVVRRDNGSDRDLDDPDQDVFFNSQALAFSKTDFDFRESGFDIDGFDQIWFFGDFPMNEAGDPDEEGFHPLKGDEVRIVAEWMDRGGGVFATGDHFNLGASMCAHIPRVRSMRRWTVAQGVPPQMGPYRNETLQGTETFVNGDDAREGDSVPQPIELVYTRRPVSILLRPVSPHPLFCVPGGGVVDHFPDHMHEGEVIEDGDVALDQPLNIPRYDRPEFPPALPLQVARFVATDGVTVINYRPVPRVLAHGRTTIPLPPLPVIAAASTAEASGSPLLGGLPFPGVRVGKRFGLVGAYDGDSAGIGRVVVDSTWHHWFSYNLHGFQASNVPQFEKMQAYYRNVALWLARPSQRQTMLVAAMWGVVVSDPMAFPAARPDTLWGIGRRALEVMSRTASECSMLELASAYLTADLRQLFSVDGHVDSAAPDVDGLEPGLFVRAVAGGLASSLLEPAAAYRKHGFQRPKIDEQQLAKHANEGLADGIRALAKTLKARATSSGSIAADLASITGERQSSPTQPGRKDR